MENSQSDTEPQTFDPTRRRLCSDGACVGVLGDDGRCRVCGRTEAQVDAGEAGLAAEGAVGASPDAGAVSADAAAAGGFDPRRRLCDDGGCVGVVGDDGACRVCGRRAE